MKKILILATLVLFLTGCADVSPHTQECMINDPYGFWSGIWHGMSSPFAFIYSLFVDDVAIYALDNNGNWYNFGFILGIGGLSGGAGSSSKRK